MFFKIRLYSTAIVTFAIWSLLAWDYSHGGVPSHHILNNKDLPGISNWWGGLLLPCLTWFLVYRVQKMITHQNEPYETSDYQQYVLYRFAGALIFGVLLSVFFSFGYTDLAGNMILLLFPAALFFQLYRAECLLGFIIGMTYTFGGVLPVGIGLIFALISAVLYLLIRPGVLYIAMNVARKLSANK
ncbi:hypothetical protein FY528_01450 [Hymenobacter lutimineralis]|uniref:Uncharacterized protein n=1 Tax=Hymenobacter lutimineralis TaxID=2606448 RepID=A0A5D6VH45_9BACT|nr:MULTISPECIES: hypothetical protein [Hymenobacter]QIX60156.1 hypothetical protein HER32_02715 [Hymenobacter sp. BT18]TYZ14422.1 hypothetical protein FY528_01450 [Hymenobacter lutimineralis]